MNNSIIWAWSRVGGVELSWEESEEGYGIEEGIFVFNIPRENGSLSFPIFGGSLFL